MTHSDRMTRRAVVRAVGLATASAALAGCIDESSVNDPNESTDGDSQPSDEQGSEPNDTGDEDRSNGDDESADDAGEEQIPAPPELELRGERDGWRVLAPDGLEGDVNPDLLLEAGRTYRIGWTEGDGLGHNIEIRDTDGNVVDDLSTPVTQDPDGEQWLEFEATEEMAAYVCTPHESTMRGELSVETPVDRGSDSSDGEEPAQDREFRIEPETTIELYARTADWRGIAPAALEDVANPTLVLEAGERYELGWTDGDGAEHNIRILDTDGNVIDDLRTDLTSDPGDEQVLAFEASEEMAIYTCEPHRSHMQGDIRIDATE
ncbi:plastocyanin/azurin family copper-binding protein [Haloterrigena salinisoli]|uniref:plastocyanin/azurin family copper-binding protein n=1 Tax=Haloterrigena salinisoli TaxID=3132747 RepID=UPI0030D5C9ED